MVLRRLFIINWRLLKLDMRFSVRANDKKMFSQNFFDFVSS